MKLQRHITSKSYLFKVIVEHLMTLCWGIAETITAWVLNLLNLFTLPDWRRLEWYWKANWASISSCSKKPATKPVDYKRIYQKLVTLFLLIHCSCQFDLFIQVCVENYGKRAKKIFYILELSGINSVQNHLLSKYSFCVFFSLFIFFLSMSHFFQLADNYHVILICYLTKN